MSSSLTSNPLTKTIIKSAVKDQIGSYSLSLTTEEDIDNQDDHLNPHDSLDINPTSQLNLTPEEIKEIKKYNYILRISFIICASLMILVAILNITTISLSVLFIAFYVFFFGVIICCYELALSGISRWIAENFGFMYTKIGRFLFILFVSFLCYDLGLFGIIVMCLLILSICGNFYVLYKCPKYEDWVRLQHFKNMGNK